MSKESIQDIEMTRQEVRDCAEKAFTKAHPTLRKYARSVVVGWSMTFGWCFFMFACGMSLSEYGKGWYYFGAAVIGIIFMIMRTISIRKRAQSLYEETCLQPLFDTLGDWVSYAPKKGLGESVKELICLSEELTESFDAGEYSWRHGEWVQFSYSDQSTYSDGEHLVTGELLGVPFKSAQLDYTKSESVGNTTTTQFGMKRSVFHVNLPDASSPELLYVLPNPLMLLEMFSNSLLSTDDVPEAEEPMFTHLVSFREDKEFAKMFLVLCRDEEFAQELMTPDIRASLLELAPHFGLTWPALVLRGNELAVLEANADTLFYSRHPSRVNLPQEAANWLELLCEVVMLAKEVNASLMQMQR